MPITNFSKTFNNVKAPILNAIQSVLPIVCGVPESVLSGISDRYVLELTATLGGNFLGFGAQAKPEITIHAYLQDKITFTNRSDWQGIIQDIPGASDLIKGVADSAVQAAFGRTLQSTISTQRKWAGSSPVEMNLKLKFEAVNDVFTEVLQPCMALQSLTLPRGGAANAVGLIPPGPSPYTLTQSSDPTVGGRGEKISINIGNFIGFRNVIVKAVTITYENRMSAAGPIGATADLTIETWRMLTREELQAAYKEKMSTSVTNKIGAVG